MDASIVIPTCNRREKLVRLLELLRPQVDRRGVEVLVVDDGSTDDTHVAAHCTGIDGLRVLRAERSGPAAARNRGARAARGDLLVFVDDDVEPQPGWLAGHLAFHRRHASAWAWGRTPIAADTVDEFEYPNAHGFLRVQRHAHRLRAGDRLPWSDFVACNISLPRASLYDVGMFDERFPVAHYEDLELAYRAHRHGIRLLVADAPAHHFGYRGVRAKCRWAIQNGYSRAILVERHPELHERCATASSYGFRVPVDLNAVEPLPAEVEQARLRQVLALEQAARANRGDHELLRHFRRRAAELFVYFEAVGMRGRMAGERLEELLAHHLIARFLAPV